MRNFIVKMVANYFFYVGAWWTVTSKSFQNFDIGFLQPSRKGTIFLCGCIRVSHSGRGAWGCALPHLTIFSKTPPPKPTKLTKKALSNILLHVFCLHFLRIHHGYFFQRVFKSVRAQFLSGNISGLLVIYLYNYNFSKSTFSMLKMQLDVFLITVFIK